LTLSTLCPGLRDVSVLRHDEKTLILQPHSITNSGPYSHLDALRALLQSRNLDHVYSEDEIIQLSLVWHRLRPWQDSAAGLSKLGRRYITSTLSNGNRQLLVDLETFGSLGFQKIISAEDFKRYKPHPEVYLGAVRELGLRDPSEVALVAAQYVIPESMSRLPAMNSPPTSAKRNY